MKSNKYENPFSLECDKYSFKFDEALEKGDWDTTKKLIEECEKIVDNNRENIYAPIYYHIGTAYSNLMNNLKEYDDEITREKMLYYYRTCLELLSEKELENSKYKSYIIGLKIPLLSNYANALSGCGRNIASIRYYRQILEIRPNFQIARGNMGVELLYYSMLIHDNRQQSYLHHFSYHYLKSSVNDNSSNVCSNEKKYFQSVIDKYSDEYIKGFLEKPLNIEEYSLGDSQESHYRKWCLNKHAFLNPLNDLSLQHSCFASDTLQLPGITTSIDKKDIADIYFGMFNQIKQEYIFARYLCYQAHFTSGKQHYADKETNLVNLYDYPQYSIRIESAKASFRILYSIFDKIAFFINIYWDLGIEERNVTFHSIWRGKSICNNKNNNNKLYTNDNIALESMRWIYKDFNEKFREEEPKSKKINILRNALEHKYVKVHWDAFDLTNLSNDNITYPISECDLLKYNLELMDMIRELIISLSMAVYIEEDKRYSNKFKHKINLFTYEDEWKI